MGLVARILGEPLMPWQQHVADVVLEVDPDTGLLVYREYVIVVGRQCGKTSWVRSKLAHRALGFTEEDPERPPSRRTMAQHTIYTAQTGDKARDKWLHDQTEVYERSPLAEMIQYIRTRLNGERLQWANGSSHRPVTPNAKTGGTGESIDEAVIDEAWARDDESLESAMKPAMITRLQPQLGVTSTAKRQPQGQHSAKFAGYLRAKIQAGRERIRAGIDSDTAFFDWSAPLDKDPSDPRTWWAHIPAMGETINENAIRSNFETMEMGHFCAEYLGWWEDESAQMWQIISQSAWDSLADRDLAPGYPLAFAVDVTPARGMCAIASAGPALGGQRMCVEITDHHRGTEWAVARIVGLVDRWRPCAVVINPGSAANSLLKPIENALIGANLDPKVLKMPTVREVSEAYGQFHDRATDSRDLRHAAQPELDAAVSIARRRRVAGGAWAWDWNSPGDISPLASATLAAWGSTVYGPGHQSNDYDVLKSVF